MTTPKRVLLACELGTGPRALDRLLPLATGLAAAGHSITLALRDPRISAGFAESDGWATVVAPAWRAAPPPGFLATGFADILLQCGYATPEALRGLLAGWRQLFTTAQPDLLIADFSPTAMLLLGEVYLRL